MAKRNGAAVDVGGGRVQTEFTDAGDRLTRKCLVQLHAIDLVHTESGAFEQLADCRDWPNPHHGGFDACN